MKGFFISIKASKLLETITKIDLFKGAANVTVEATERMEKKVTKSGKNIMYDYIRFSTSSGSGNASFEQPCIYVPYDREITNEGSEDESFNDTYLEEPCIEDAVATVPIKQFRELAKQLGDSEENLTIDFFTEKNRLTVTKSGKFATQLMIPLAETKAETAAGNEQVYSQAVVKSGWLRKIAKDSTVILRNLQVNGKKVEEADSIKFSFAEDMTVFIADKTMLSLSHFQAEEYTRASSEYSDFYGVKGEDFRCVSQIFGNEEKVIVSLKGDNEPKAFEFTSLETGAKYLLPRYGKVLVQANMVRTLASKNAQDRDIRLSFNRDDFCKAVSLLQIGYAEPELKLILEDGDRIVLQQAKGNKPNTIELPGNVEIKSRAHYGEGFDSAEGPVTILIFASHMVSLLKSLWLREEDLPDGTKCVEKARVRFYDLVTVFENIPNGDELFTTNYMSTEQFKLYCAKKDEILKRAAGASVKVEEAIPEETVSEEAERAESTESTIADAAE